MNQSDRQRRTRVFKRDRYKCQICGQQCPKARLGTQFPNAPTVDHIKPTSLGGHNGMRNLQTACLRCNGLKAAEYECHDGKRNYKGA